MTLTPTFPRAHPTDWIIPLLFFFFFFFLLKFLSPSVPPSQLPPPSPTSSRLDSCSPPLSQAQLSPCPSVSFIPATFRAPLHLSPLRRHSSPLSSASRLYIPSSHTNGPVVLLIFPALFFNSVPSACFQHSVETQFYQVSEESSQQEMVRLCNPCSAL